MTGVLAQLERSNFPATAGWHVVTRLACPDAGR